MSSKPLGIAALAIATVAAAGVGSYLALKPSAAAMAPVAVTATNPAGAPAALSDVPAATPSAPAVSETEAVVTPPPAPAAPATPIEAPRAASVDRTPAPVPAPRASRPAPREVPEPRRSPARATATPAPASQPASTVPARPSPTVATNGHTPGQVEAGRPYPMPTEIARTAEPVPAVIEPVAPAPPPEPPKPEFVEYVLPTDAVMGLQIENSVNSSMAKVEDRVEAHVTRDVRVGGEVAVPAGSRVRGNVTLVEQGGKFKEQARLGVRFHTIVLADGSTVPISTETIYRNGDSMGNRSAAKIGGAAVGGAIIGAILGGGKGAAIGAGVGAGAGTGATMAGPRSQAVLQAGSTVTVKLAQPATVRIEKEN